MGFFRLWVVFTFIWVGSFVAVLLFDKTYIPEAYVFTGNSGRVVKISPYEKDAGELLELAKSGEFLSGNFPEFPNYTFFVRPKGLATQNAEYIAKSIGLDKFIQKDHDSFLKEHRRSSLMLFLKGGLLVPLAILAFGFAVRWVLMGFKRT